MRKKLFTQASGKQGSTKASTMTVELQHLRGYEHHVKTKNRSDEKIRGQLSMPLRKSVLFIKKLILLTNSH